MTDEIEAMAYIAAGARPRHSHRHRLSPRPSPSPSPRLGHPYKNRPTVYLSVPFNYRSVPFNTIEDINGKFVGLNGTLNGKIDNERYTIEHLKYHSIFIRSQWYFE